MTVKLVDLKAAPRLTTWAKAGQLTIIESGGLDLVVEVDLGEENQSLLKSLTIC